MAATRKKTRENSSGLPTGFSVSCFVVATLANPREKFWGRLLAIDPRGAVVCGIPVDSFEDFVRQLRAGEAAVPVVTFFPMHRLQSIEEERRDGALPSLSDRLRRESGRKLDKLFSAPVRAASASRRGEVRP